ncbi:MAG: nucleotidyltransferase family protein [Oscillospiraceae bacterium]|nr:nucleotidyltransferase family protein [Oscillospiraceae bacterium]
MDNGHLLLQALKAAIRGETVQWDGLCRQENWQKLFRLARAHHVLPLLLDVVHSCPDFLAVDEQLRRRWKREAMQLSAGQTMRAVAFSRLYTRMILAGLKPLVMKGAVCRSLYPNPCLRPSSDEDVLVHPTQFLQAVEFLESQGLRCLSPEADARREHELGFISPEGMYIELHCSPFPPESAALQQCNAFFSEAAERLMTVVTQELEVLTLSPHDHMLYLLLHAFKHFIHSGFGIRQVCDILLWAEHYGEKIDWALLLDQCRQIRCEKFSLTVFAVAREYLGFDAEKAGIEHLLEENLPAEELLQDMLGAGVFGGSSRSRKHSASITLNAVEADRKGKKTSLLSTLFPPRAQLQGRYPYLQKRPVLLPVAWCDRIIHYAGERSEDNAASESVQIGRQRKALLRQLDIME